MKPWVRNTVGVLCHVPGIYMLFFMAFMILMITNAPKENGHGMPIWFAVVFIFHIFVMLLMFLLMAFFVIWLLKGTTLSTEAKVIWAIGSFMIGPIIMPILYWLYLRKMPDGPYFFGAPLSEATPQA
jgi:hypothetical protein